MHAVWGLDYGFDVLAGEGHGGYIGTDILKAAGTGVRPGGADGSDQYKSDSRDLATWFDGQTPDILLWHFGTNDVWNGKQTSKILEAYSAILAKARSRNPVLTGASLPLPIDVDVSGVQELHLVANDDGGNGSEHADWVNIEVECDAAPAERQRAEPVHANTTSS